MNAVEAQERPATGGQANSSPEMKAFIGSWEIDPARTKLGAITTSYEQVGDSIRVTTPRGSYTFKIDGNEYPTAVPGGTVAWKQLDKNTFETTSKRKGEVDAVITRVLSPDGKTIDVTTKLMGEKPRTVTSRMERQTALPAGNPLIGTWKHARDSSSVQNMRLTYTPVANGLQVRYDAPMRQEYTLIFDGKEHEVTAAGGNDRLSVRKLNERSFEERWTRDGKLMTTSTITVSSDGQELVEQHQPSGQGGESSTYVFRRVK